MDAQLGKVEEANHHEQIVGHLWMRTKTNGSKQHRKHHAQAITLAEDQVKASDNHRDEGNGGCLGVVTGLYDDEEI